MLYKKWSFIISSVNNVMTQLILEGDRYNSGRKDLDIILFEKHVLMAIDSCNSIGWLIRIKFILILLFFLL